MRLLFAGALLLLYTLLSAQTPVFINEIHYDNNGGDNSEGIEIVGPAGTSLSGWSVEFYNGNGGGRYSTLSLSGTIDDEGNGYGAVWFNQSGIQNGAPDGMALIDGSNNVVQFLSYEGSFTATSGTASGLTSTDIGVSQSSSNNDDETLQLIGTGQYYEDFSWTGPVNQSRDDINVGQSFGSTTYISLSISRVLGFEDSTSTVVITATSSTNVSSTKTVDVSISGAQSSDYSLSNNTISIPAGSSTGTTTLTILDDTDTEGIEDWTISLVNPSSGVVLSIPSALDLEVEDNEVPKVMIVEIMKDPDAVNDNQGEWFEVWNISNSAVDLNGWTIEDLGSNSHTISSSLVIPANEYAVLGRNSNPSQNGNYTPDYVYGNDIQLANGDDEVILLFTDGTSIVDRVYYDGGTQWPSPTGASFHYTGAHYQDNNLAVYWQESVAREPGFSGSGDAGSPGQRGFGQSTFMLLSNSFIDVEVGEEPEGIRLRWTAEGIDPQYYVVEKSLNGSQFEPLVETTADTWLDENPEGGDNFYRVVAYSAQGTPYSSKMVFMRWEERLFFVYPNPSSGQFTLVAADFPEDMYFVEWVDINGQIVNRLPWRMSGAKSTFEGHLSLAPGQYMIVLRKTDGYIVDRKLWQVIR